MIRLKRKIRKALRTYEGRERLKRGLGLSIADIPDHRIKCKIDRIVTTQCGETGDLTFHVLVELLDGTSSDWLTHSIRLRDVLGLHYYRESLKRVFRAFRDRCDQDNLNVVRIHVDENSSSRGRVKESVFAMRAAFPEAEIVEERL